MTTSKEELVKIEKLKEKAVEAEEKRKEVIETSKELKEQYNTLGEIDTAKPTIYRGPTANVSVDTGIDTFTQQGLTDLGIYLPIETTTQEEIKEILKKREIVPATPITHFDLNYDIELIPTPDRNKIYSLTTVERNIWDKPTYGLSANNVEMEETHVLKNFIYERGGKFNISVTGVHNTRFNLAIFNEVDNTYYNWDKVNKTVRGKTSEQDYVTEVSGQFDEGFSYFSGIIPANGKETISFIIPSVISGGRGWRTEEGRTLLDRGKSVEKDILCEDKLIGCGTTYRVGFVPQHQNKETRYNEGLPMFCGLGKGSGHAVPCFGDENYVPLYKITQLNQCATIIGPDFSLGEENHGEEYYLTIRHTPGSMLNSSNATNGKYDVDITLNSRHELELSNNIPGGILTMAHLDQNIPVQWLIAIGWDLSEDDIEELLSESRKTEILDIDLVASIINNPEADDDLKITGSITLGKASLKTGVILFRMEDIFVRVQDSNDPKA